MSDKIFKSSVLLVDDEEEILIVNEKMIKSEVDHVFTTTNPCEALEIVKKHRVDLAILDLKMPEMDGITLLSKLRLLSPNTSYFIYSAYGDKKSIQNALRIGIDDFIDKPCSIDYFKKAIKNALSKKQYEYLLSEIIEMLVSNCSQVSLQKFSQMSYKEKSKNINAILEIAKLKVFKRQNFYD
ncbi:MAG: response regulator [Oligoflexia bacterium]|nr:response regulator [Oligoflexia bacterium]